jgi:hypothetical protein
MRRITSILSLSILASTMGCDLLPAPSFPIELSERTRSTANLSNYQSCDALESDLKDHLREEMRVQLLIAREQMMTGYGFGGIDDGLAVEESAMAGDSSADSGARQEGVDFSGTNNQETGVDEADIVKTDGYFIYTLNGDRLEILGVPQFGELNHASSVAIEGYPKQLLLSEDRAVVFSNLSTYQIGEDHPLAPFVVNNNQDQYWWRGTSLSKMTVIDLGESRQDPQVVRELYLEGWQMTAREIDGTVRSVSYSYFDIQGLQYWPMLPESYYMMEPFDPSRQQVIDQAVANAMIQNDTVISAATLSDFVPNLYEVRGEAASAHPFGNGSCDNFSIADDGFSRGFSSIMSLDLNEDSVSFESDHVMSNWPIVYASTDTLVIAEQAQDWWWFWGNDNFEEATNIHRFDISENGVTDYTGSGRVPGHVMGQFAFSEYEGNIRVATTRGSWMRWWLDNPPPVQNFVHVLAGDTSLDTIGLVGPIAENERIWSSRFVGDKGYLVTFQNIDPLWTIDLSDPKAPKVIGELEIPGVSTYIHPVSDEELLTIGIAGDNDGLFWGQTQLSTFDVSDFANPQQASTLRLSPAQDSDNGWTYGWSEATYEHKAFQYWGPQSLLAIPLSTYRYTNNGYEYISKLELVNVQEGEPLSVFGSIDHSDFYNGNDDDWWYYRDVRRSIFMGDFIYAISDRGVTCHRLDDLTMTASVGLEGASNYYGY